MKFLLLAVFAAISYTLWVDFHPQVITAKSMTSATRLESWRSAQRNTRALDALRGSGLKLNDPGRAAETRATLAALHAGDPLRAHFAELLEKRGDAWSAFDLMRVHVHFGESSTPDDRQMALYARLAERTGHPEEAAWARERMGPEGHYRNWRRFVERFLSRRGSAWPTGREGYVVAVNSEMDNGLELNPRFRGEIEALREELLAAP